MGTHNLKSSDFLTNLGKHHSKDPRFAESFRYLRTNIEFSFSDKEFQSLLITSTDQDEGKTTIVLNLAYTLAQAGKTILIVDGDLRNPKLTPLATSDDTPGLSGLLSEVLNTDAQSGSLSEYGLSDLFWLISFQKKTGILHLSQGNEKLDISFSHGKFVDINWLTRPEEKKLLSVLVDNKAINKEQAAQSLNRQKDTGQQLGYILINMGFIDPAVLEGYIKLHTIEGLRIGLELKSGSFSFEKLHVSHFEKSSYNPFDVSKVYKEVIIGMEELPFFQKSIYAAIVESSVENLFFLPSGPLPPKPAELLGSTRMSFLISFLKNRFDILVIDSSPVLPTSDPLLLAPQMEGVILVVKSGHLNRVIVQKAVEQLQTTKANLIGVVLNRINLKRERYYQYYSKYYGKN